MDDYSLALREAGHAIALWRQGRDVPRLQLRKPDESFPINVDLSSSTAEEQTYETAVAGAVALEIESNRPTADLHSDPTLVNLHASLTRDGEFEWYSEWIKESYRTISSDFCNFEIHRALRHVATALLVCKTLPQVQATELLSTLLPRDDEDQL